MLINTLNPSNLDWEKVSNLMPVIIQHAQTLRVLMLGYMNAEALEKTINTGDVTFFSRTKKRLWIKGEESGHFLKVVSIAQDCDADTLLIQVTPVGPTCHTGAISCFDSTFKAETMLDHPALHGQDLAFLSQLENIIKQRKNDAPESSYTAKLFAQGTKRIAQKVGEEGVEIALAATVHHQEEMLNEGADLIFHLLVLLQQENASLSEVVAVLKSRHHQTLVD
ncbi:MAG: bifunctional phosphoribosyl-AMP cyclohydrolase/phosphoribosyl-ATP diphosphatase HisIE [Neisseriaceae bacterium]|nr:bifunctional phosphoribosyl-AMP cyclohydrolase/phosphoribosyl-ATP diphosphatase HisIE [Neisseriaceae bacterium]